jgi:hypothetical protein
MSFDSGLQYYDRSNNYKLYVYQSGAWHEMSALWDGSTVASGTVTTLNSTTGTITTLNSTTVNATSATIGLLSGTTLTGFTTIAGTNLSGTLLNYSQPNVTDVGSLTALTVSASGVNINISNTAESTSGLNVYDTQAPTTQFMHLDYDAYNNNCLFNTPSGGWHLRLAGVNKFTVGTSDVTLPATNLRLSSGNVRATHAASTGYVSYASATNASYSSEIVQLVATRSASSSFKFLATRSSAGADIEHNLRGDGNGFCDGSWTGGGADFAEFMEWEDGNPANEDRTGMVVQFSKPKNGHPYIERCTDPKKAVGVVSAMPTIVGGSDWNKWQGKYLKNKYGGYLTELVDYYVWTEQRVITPESNIEAQERIDQLDKIEGINANLNLMQDRLNAAEYENDKQKIDVLTAALKNATEIQQEKAKLISRIVPESDYTKDDVEVSYAVDQIPKDVVIPDNVKIESLERRVVNPDWDEGLAENHTPRADRPEWDKVGINGFVVINDEEVTAKRWKKVGTCGEGVSRWLIR